MKKELIDWLLIIVYGGLIFFIVCFVFDYIELNKFKKCYDISFQDNSCIKYFDY